MSPFCFSCPPLGQNGISAPWGRAPHTGLCKKAEALQEQVLAEGLSYSRGTFPTSEVTSPPP